MEIKANTLKVMCALACALIAGQVSAQTGGCCAGGVGANATMGLGERNPAVANLTLDPAWSIYEFQRDGVTYLQINDVAGESERWSHALTMRFGSCQWARMLIA
ncbi:hypothetical protein WIW49_11310 [Xanthomonas euroxanthea]